MAEIVIGKISQNVVQDTRIELNEEELKSNLEENLVVNLEAGSSYQVITAGEDDADIIVQVTKSDGTTYDVVLVNLASYYSDASELALQQGLEAGDIIKRLVINIEGNSDEPLEIASFTDVVNALAATAAGEDGTPSQNQNPDTDPATAPDLTPDPLESNLGTEGENPDGETPDDTQETQAQENETPVILDVFTTATESTEGLNTITGQLVATDANESQTHQFNLVAGTIVVSDTSGVNAITLDDDNIDVSIDPETGIFTITGDFNNLAEGESATLSFTYTATDSGTPGLTSEPKTVTLVVTGTNDGPVINTVAVTTTDEDGAVISGTITSTDADQNSTATYSAPTTAGFIINAETGAYSFDPSDAAYQYLNAGDTLTVTIPVTVTDNNGATDTTNIVVTLTGTNDAPAINTVTATTADEDGAVISGTVTSTDSDQNSTATYSAPTTAGFTINEDTGVYSFDPSDAAYQSLNAGDTLTVTIPVTVTDDNNATDTTNIVVTLTGTNDAPVVTTVNSNITYTEVDGRNDWVLINDSIQTTDIDTNSSIKEVNISIETPLHGSKIQLATNNTPEFKALVSELKIVNAKGTEYTANDKGKIKTVKSTELTITKEDGSNLTQEEADIIMQAVKFATGHKVSSDAEDVVINFSVTDENNATGSTSVTVDVVGTNDTPIIKVVDRNNKKDSTDVSIDEDTSLQLQEQLNIDLSDYDQEGTMQVTLSVEHGVLSVDLGSLTNKITIISGDDTNTIILEGSTGNLNKLLDGKKNASVTYTPDENYNGSDELEIALSDQGDRGFEESSVISTVNIDIDSRPDFINWNGDIVSNSTDSININENSKTSELNKKFKIEFGDDTGTVAFNGFESAVTQSAGLDIQTEYTDGNVIGFTIDDENNRTEVFTLTIDSDTDGAPIYSFTLLQSLDHVENIKDGESVSLRFAYTATDSNGDSIDGKVVVNVDDGVPQITDPVDTTLNESDLSYGGVGYYNIGVDTNGGANNFVLEHGQSQFKVGGEGVGGKQPLTLTLLAELWDGELKATGNFSKFDPDAQISVNSNNIVNIGGKDTGGNYKFQFSSQQDADKFADFVKQIKEDGYLNELFQDEGNLKVKKSLNIDWGSDSYDVDVDTNTAQDTPSENNRSVTFSSDTTAPEGLTSNEQTVVYVFNEDKTVLTAMAGDNIVFKVTLSDEIDLNKGLSGSYTFELFETLDHIDDFDDLVNLGFNIVATDSDGDTANGTFNVAITDDAVLANNDMVTINEDPKENKVSVNVLSNDDVSIDGTTLIAAEITTVEYGESSANTAPVIQSVQEGGKIIVKLPENFNGAFKVSYTIEDADGDRSTAEVSYTVNPINDIATITTESVYDNGVNLDPRSIQEVEIGGYNYTNNTLAESATQTIERSAFTYDGEKAQVLVNGTLADFDGDSGRNDAFEVTLKEGELLELDIDAGNTFEIYNKNDLSTQLDSTNGAGTYIVVVHSEKDNENHNANNLTYSMSISITGIANAEDFINITDETGEVIQNHIILDEEGNVTGSKLITVDREDFSVVDDDTIAHIFKGNIAGNNGSADHAYNDAFGFSLEYGEKATLSFLDSTVNSEYKLYKVENGEFTELTIDDSGEFSGEGEYAVRIESENNAQGGQFELQLNIDASPYVIGNIDDVDSDFEATMVGLLASAEDAFDDNGNPNTLDEINLSNGEHVLSNISLEDFIAITDDDNTLKITGESNDQVKLDSSLWTTDDVVDSEGFVHYSATHANQTLKLLVEQDITTNVD